MSTKHLREAVAAARDLGVIDVRIEQRGKHPHLVGTTPAGIRLRLVLPGSPSDGVHGARNTLAELRRACRDPARPARQPREVGERRQRRMPEPRRAPAPAPAPVPHQRGRETVISPFGTPAMLALRERLEAQQGRRP
jgi:hypothetical protein